MYTVVAFDKSRDLIAPLAEYLRGYGLAVHLSKSILDIPSEAAKHAADIIVLAVDGYDQSALDTLQDVGAGSQVPTVVWAKSNDDFSGIVYLEVGADDYLSQPLHPRVFVARLHAAIRRNRIAAADAKPDQRKGASKATFLGWEFDRYLKTLVSPEGRRIALSETQSTLLDALLQQPRRILSRSDLIRHLGRQPAKTTDDVIMSHISRLRRKFEPDTDGARLIKSERLTGYAFNEPVTWR